MRKVQGRELCKLAWPAKKGYSTFEKTAQVEKYSIERQVWQQQPLFTGRANRPCRPLERALGFSVLAGKGAGRAQAVLTGSQANGLLWPVFLESRSLENHLYILVYMVKDLSVETSMYKEKLKSFCTGVKLLTQFPGNKCSHLRAAE